MRTTSCNLVFLMAVACLMTPAITLAAKGEDGFPGYMELRPSVVVNLANTRRAKYARIDIQLFIPTDADAALVTLHMPRIRDRLISLLAGRDGATMITTQERDALRAELLEDLRQTMLAQTGKPAIDALYFTGFIIQ